jgi:hypothetical protein
MILQSDEYLHAAGSSSDWEERYRLNFADKKTKVFGFADMIIRPSAGECVGEWHLVIEGRHFSSAEIHSCVCREGAKSVGSKSIKYKISGKHEIEVTLKNTQLEARIVARGIFPTYDFPVAPGRPSDPKREEFEMMLWKRYEQRCRVSGAVTFKEGKSKKFEAYGEREHLWGGMLWKHLLVSSRYYMQFKDLSIGLSSLSLDGSIVSNGFFSRKSGNIPVIGIELEHLEIDRHGRLKSSEISYLDSQDDRDLIVTTPLHQCEVGELRAGKRKYVMYRNFAEFTIIGANKKGIGFEEHVLLPDQVKTYSSDK